MGGEHVASGIDLRPAGEHADVLRKVCFHPRHVVGRGGPLVRLARTDEVDVGILYGPVDPLVDDGTDGGLAAEALVERPLAGRLLGDVLEGRVQAQTAGGATGDEKQTGQGDHYRRSTRFAA